MASGIVPSMHSKYKINNICRAVSMFFAQNFLNLHPQLEKVNHCQAASLTFVPAMEMTDGVVFHYMFFLKNTS